MSTPEHRFAWLPYNQPPMGEPSDEVLVAVCDCGWHDITDSGPRGTGLAAARLYAEHVGVVSPPVKEEQE